MYINAVMIYFFFFVCVSYLSFFSFYICFFLYGGGAIGIKCLSYGHMFLLKKHKSST